MVNHSSIGEREAGSTVGHDTLSLSSTHLGAEVGLLRLAENAVPFLALRSVAGDDQVSNDVVSHSFSDTLDHSSGFVTQDGREFAFGVRS